MVKVHRLSVHLRALFVTLGLGFVVMGSMLVMLGRPVQPGELSGWILCVPAGLLVAIVLAVYEFSVGRIETSPKGIVCYSSGYHFGTSWENIDRIEVSSFGIANLMFKEQPDHTPLLLTLGKGLGYHRMLQLSSYIESAATSELLQEIKRYAPQVDIDNLIQRDANWRSYQKPLVIGAYLLAWMILLVPLAAGLRNVAEAAEAAGVVYATLVTSIAGSAALFAVFVSGFGALSAAGALSGASALQIERTTKGYYVAPVVGLLGGFLVGIVVLTVLRVTHLEVQERAYGSFNMLGILMGWASPSIGSRLAQLSMGRRRA